MIIWQTITQTISDLRAHKLRTFLTAFGILWGTIIIIVLMAFGNGFKRATMKNMKSMGRFVVVLWPGETGKPYRGLGIGRGISLIEEDAKLLKTQIPEIEKISPEITQWGTTLRNERNLTTIAMKGVYPEYSDLRNIPVDAGRFINPLDMKQRRRVCFLGNEVKEKLFGNDEAVGKRITVDGIPFLVVGVLKKKLQTMCYSGMDANMVFIPYSTIETLTGRIYVSNMVYRAINPEISEDVRKRIREVLGKKYKFDSEDKEAIGFWDTTEGAKMVNKIFTGIQIFLILVGTFTLIIGGVGVANIMFVVVRERTREIGIRMAVGAKKRDILRQFLFEALVISLGGGIIGVIFGWQLVELIRLFPISEHLGKPEMSFFVAFTAAVILSIIGIVAGIFPARKAANLNPIESLRYE